MNELLDWMRRRKASTAALLLVVAGCIALVLLAKRAHHLQPTAAATTADAPSEPAARRPAPRGSRHRAGGYRADARSAKMRGEFENATQLPRLHPAGDEPAAGRRQVLRAACLEALQRAVQHKGVAEAHAGNDAFHEGALALIQDIEKRCAGVQETYPDVQSLYAVAMEQRGGKRLPDARQRPRHRRARRRATRPTPTSTPRSRPATAGPQAEALQNNADFLDVGNSAGDDGARSPAPRVGRRDRRLRAGGQLPRRHRRRRCTAWAPATARTTTTATSSAPRCPTRTSAIFDTVVEALRLRMGLAPARRRWKAIRPDRAADAQQLDLEHQRRVRRNRRRRRRAGRRRWPTGRSAWPCRRP